MDAIFRERQYREDRKQEERKNISDMQQQSHSWM